MRNVAANARYWFAGLLTALSGVALARGIVPIPASDARLFVTVLGQLLALAGLFIICLGVRRRIKRTQPAGAPPDHHPN